MKRYKWRQRLLGTSIVLQCLFSIAFASNVRAEEINVPILDVERYCGPRWHCIEETQKNYDIVKALWPILSEAQKKQALEFIKPAAGAEAYYLILRRYVESLAEEGNGRQEKGKSPPKFRP